MRRWRLAGLVLAGALAAAVPWLPPADAPASQPLRLSLPAVLQEGDLVFRQGLDAVSGAVLALDPEPQYSHVGILAKRDGAWVVIHSLPSDAAAGDPGGVRVESLQAYLAPANARAAAVYRLREAGTAAPGQALRAVRAALGFSAAQAPFDGDFDLRDHRRLYCTELVWLAFRAAGVDLAPTPDWLDLPLKSGYYILPSTLIRSGVLVRVG